MFVLTKILIKKTYFQEISSSKTFYCSHKSMKSVDISQMGFCRKLFIVLHKSTPCLPLNPNLQTYDKLMHCSKIKFEHISLFSSVNHNQTNVVVKTTIRKNIKEYSKNPKSIINQFNKIAQPR